MARRSAGLVALAVLLVLGAAGCGALTDLVDLQLRIQAAGYDVGSVFHDDFTDGSNDVQIEARARAGPDGSEGQRFIAELVWDSYPRRFEAVDVRLDGDLRRFDRAELQESFGARAPELDERTFADEVTRGVLVGMGVGAAVTVVAVVLIIVLVRRSRRRKAQRFALAGPPPGAPMPPPVPYYGVPAPPPWLPPSGYPPPMPGTTPPPPVPPPSEPPPS